MHIQVLLDPSNKCSIFEFCKGLHCEAGLFDKLVQNHGNQLDLISNRENISFTFFTMYRKFRHMGSIPAPKIVMNIYTQLEKLGLV